MNADSTSKLAHGRLLAFEFWLKTTACLALLLLDGRALGDELPVLFNRDVRPIFSENCYHCHGPDKNHREADLRLDDRDIAMDMGAIVPGDPERERADPPN